MSRGLTPKQGLVAVMATLAGPEPAGALELRHRPRDGRAAQQRFFDARIPGAPAMAATVLSQSGDVYVGCALRTGLGGPYRGWTLWVECDDPESVAALEQFDPQPAILTRSSETAVQAYWPLEEPLGDAELEEANRQLAQALGGRQTATRAAALLRPPATLNYRYDPPTPVTLERFTRERFHHGKVRPSGEPSSVT